MRLAAESCELPIAFIRVADLERPWLKASTGLETLADPIRFGAFSPPHAPGETCLIEDAREDARTQGHPLVQAEPPLRFYLALPLRNEEGEQVGALCLMDHVPRRMSAPQSKLLEHLRRQAETQLRLRAQLLEAQEQATQMEEAHARLYALNENLQIEVRQRQHIQRELLSQRELLTQVLAHIPFAVFWKDRDGNFLGCNDAFAQQVDVSSPRDVIGRTDLELGLLPSMVEAYRRDDLVVMDSGMTRFGIEEPFRRPHGEDRWLLTSKVPLRDPDGQVRSVLGIFADITDRRRQEAVLQQALWQVKQYAALLETQVCAASERIRRLMEASRDAVFVLDERGRVLELNPVAERLLGRTAAELLGVSFDTLAPEPERLVLHHALAELLSRGTMRLEDQGLCSAQGERISVQLIGSLQEAGEARRQLVVAQDLTEKRRMEQQNIQNDRLAAMGVLTAGIAHEINNPISYMLANLDLLRQWEDELEQQLPALPGLPSELLERLPEARSVIADCIEGSLRIGDIVRGMRLLSHTGQGDVLIPVDIHRSLDAVLHIAQGELKHTARLKQDYARNLPMVLGSEGRLGQVFLNLIINAVHAMRPGSPAEHVLHIRSRLDEGQVRIDISDTGHGIPPEVLPRIFDPFFTTKPAGIGTGLGLSISHAIIQKMGGSMRVESRVGHGTTFSLLMPVT
ncbi:PAS domain-containing protein [Stigmatella sp. ncwal1]|uniref:histidine kinase n=1 Tax=Stigmatella ashevillensis TaxID=2995309 RepID=A0ABT5D2A9_9BACT|nr:PAS domain-containing protein [Stigmatella ashevillena]MDC0707691.1 PAS domain-containing protein [Stigmatella ashevillena]